jgi:hypothetical protein
MCAPRAGAIPALPVQQSWMELHNACVLYNQHHKRPPSMLEESTRNQRCTGHIWQARQARNLYPDIGRAAAAAVWQAVRPSTCDMQRQHAQPSNHSRLPASTPGSAAALCSCAPHPKKAAALCQPGASGHAGAAKMQAIHASSRAHCSLQSMQPGLQKTKHTCVITHLTHTTSPHMLVNAGRLNLHTNTCLRQTRHKYTCQCSLTLQVCKLAAG